MYCRLQQARGWGSIPTMSEDFSFRPDNADSSAPYARAEFHLLADFAEEYATFSLDVERRVLTWNQGAERLYGYERNDILGQPVSKLYLSQPMTRVAEQQAEGWHIRENGSRFWARSSTTVLRDGEGNVAGYAVVTRDLSDRRAAEAALRHGEEPFRLLVEQVRDYAIFLLSPTGHVTSWNRGAEQIKGYRPEEIIGEHFSVFYPEADVMAGKCDRELAVASKEGRFEDEGWRVRKNGGRFWANVIITALRNDDGKLIGFAKVTRDLSERRRAEEQRLRVAELEQANRVKEEYLEREQRAHRAAEAARSSLATTLQSIGDAVIATDELSNVTLMNPIAERLTGWRLEEALGQPLAGVFHIINQTTRRLVESPVERVLREGIVVGLANHTVLVARDGSEKPIQDTGAPIKDESGTIRGVVLVFRDASAEYNDNERRHFLAEATSILSASLDYRETLAKVAQLLVPRLADWCSVEVSEDGESLEVMNVAHVDPLKIELARELRKRFPPDPKASQGIPQVIRTGRAEYYPEITDQMLVEGSANADHLRALRQLQLRSCIIVPLTAGGRTLGAILLVFAESGRTYAPDDLDFAQELGRRAAAAIENARLYAAEQRARDLADSASRAKDEFLALVSHELRTPLSAILGWTKMLATTSLEEPKRARAIKTIERNGIAMAQLIEDLLDVSRIVSGKLRLDASVVEIVSIVQAAIEAVQPLAQAKKVEIQQDIAQAGPVMGDATRLQQIAWNLLSNAVKFTPAGGKVCISLANTGSHAEIVVTDTGKGIEPRFLPHVFEPFRQAESVFARAAGGLGLGLAIVKHLVDLHGGQVKAESEGVDRGSRFSVRLPLVQERPVVAPGLEARHGARAVTPVAQLGDIRALVVEDQADMRQLLEEVLAESGCVVLSATSVAEALTFFERGTLPDILLSDIGMPGETGLDLIRRVRELPPDRGGQVPAAALTAYARADDRREALAAGFDLHLAKPIELAEVIQAASTLARLARR